MNASTRRELSQRFREQYGVVTRAQLAGLGISSAVVRHHVALGEWELLGPRLVRLTAVEATHEQRLLGLCLVAGPSAIASHLSAAWLWRLAEPPVRHSVIVPRSVSGRYWGGDVHRPKEFPSAVSITRRIPCTNPLRTLLDVGATCSPELLDEFVDRALASSLVTLEAIEAELVRSGRRGRPGCGALRSTLKWRKAIGGNKCSVLESKALKLLYRAGIKPLSTEVKVAADLNYRVDILLVPGLAIEVDGYAYHHSAAQMTEDASRRNRLLASGTRVLIYGWRDIVHNGYRVLADVHTAMANLQRAPRLAPVASA